jgi:hypothetical protein
MSTKKQQNDYSDTYNRFAEESAYFSSLPGWDERTALLKKLHRYETTLNRINENDCNGHPRTVTETKDGKTYRYDVEDTRWEERDRKKENIIQAKVRTIAQQLGFGVFFNGDPRGGAIRFILPSHASNNWDQKSWGIYW